MSWAIVEASKPSTDRRGWIILFLREREFGVLVEVVAKLIETDGGAFHDERLILPESSLAIAVVPRRRAKELKFATRGLRSTCSKRLHSGAARTTGISVEAGHCARGRQLNDCAGQCNDNDHSPW